MQKPKTCPFFSQGFVVCLCALGIWMSLRAHLRMPPGRQHRAENWDSPPLQLYECHGLLISSVTRADCINSANMSICSVQHNSAKICIYSSTTRGVGIPSLSFLRRCFTHGLVKCMANCNHEQNAISRHLFIWVRTRTIKAHRTTGANW